MGLSFSVSPALAVNDQKLTASPSAPVTSRLRDQMHGRARRCHTQTDKRVSLLIVQCHSKQIEPQYEPHRGCAREGERAMRYLGPRCDFTMAQ
jgi:hypothetical protein